MEEFLRQNYSLITHSVEVLAAITGIIFFKKYKLVAAKYFILFLVYAAIVDFIGEYPNLYNKWNWLSALKASKFRYNYWFFSIFYILACVVFYCFYYNKVLRNKTFKKTSILICVSTIAFSIVYIAFNIEDFFIGFIPLICVLSALSILIYTIFYFIEVLQSDKILKFYKSINFYISIGIFFWWLITTPVIFYGVYNSNEDWNFVLLKWQIYLFANIFMYITFTIGLIVSKPEEE
ncbi:hypothetical protein [Lacinutrix chionoecetis]